MWRPRTSSGESAESARYSSRSKRPRRRLRAKTYTRPRTGRVARARLLRLIQRLEPIDRQLMLAWLEGLDENEMSEITGLSAANVWTRIHRIKNVLTRRFHAGERHAG